MLKFALNNTILMIEYSIFRVNDYYTFAETNKQ